MPSMRDVFQPLDIHLRMGRSERLPTNLRQLGAVGPYVPPPPAGSPRVIVAGAIRRGDKMHTMGKQERPIEQYLTQQKGREGQDAVVFTHPDRPRDLQRFLQAIPQDPHQFRLSISPAVSATYFPLRPYAEAFMARVERDLGRPLDWIGAAHYDTPHPHVHILLRGRDLDMSKAHPFGKQLYLTNDYLARGLRYRAIEMAGWLLDPDRHRQQQRTTAREPQRPQRPERRYDRDQEMERS